MNDVKVIKLNKRVSSAGHLPVVQEKEHGGGILACERLFSFQSFDIVG